MPAPRGPRRKDQRKDRPRPGVAAPVQKSTSRLPNTLALLLTGVAVLAVVRAIDSGGDVAANVVAALAAMAALVALSAMSDAGRGSDTPPPLHDPAYAALQEGEHRGSVKRFSQRNGWGLIACEVGDSADFRNHGAPRRDVRFYRREKEDLSLEVGDAVWFRAIPDQEANGWLKAVHMRRGAAPATAVSDASESPPHAPVAVGLLQGGKTEDVQEHLELNGHAVAKEVLLNDVAKEQVEASPCVERDSALEASLPERPPSTPVVARRLVHSHLEVPLSAEKRAEERAFWEGSPQRSSPERGRDDHDSDCQHSTSDQRADAARGANPQKGDVPASCATAAAPVKRHPLATLRAATAPDGVRLLSAVVAAATDQTAALATASGEHAGLERAVRPLA